MKGSLELSARMFGTITVLLFLAVIGLALTVFTGLATTFKEAGMLYGIGGWPGRIAALHGIVWMAVLFYTGPPANDWVAITLIGVVFLGTVCGPFYANNRRLLGTLQDHAEPAAANSLLNADGDYLPLTGTVVLEEDAVEDSETAPWNVRPVTAPFTASDCAACEWAVKKKQRVSRRNTYTTVDYGTEAGEFVIATEHGQVGVDATDPTLLLISDVGFTGYETTTTNPGPAGESETSDSVLSSLRSREMKYCESTVEAGDTVTIVGPVENESGEYRRQPTVRDDDETVTYIIDKPFGECRRAAQKYLQWTPHLAVAAFGIGWGYIVLSSGIPVP